MAEPRRARAGLAIAAFLFAVASCSPSAGEVEGLPSTPPRSGRFGSLRDFVLFDLPAGVLRDGERALFVDRFEVTRGDWAEFAATPAGVAVLAQTAAMHADRALPVSRVDLLQARTFARWRFARLPRHGEWAAILSGDGRYRFPWSSKVDATRANTAELGLGEPTPVGTFESGRRESVLGQPYDLIGNVSEWTETVPVEWCLDAGERLALLDAPGLAFAVGRRHALGTAALAIWQPLPGIMPPIAAVAAHSELVPRLVVGGDFQSSMLGPDDAVHVERVLAGDRRLRTGLRLVTTPGELLTALAGADVTPAAADYEQLSRFIARGRHRAVLRAAFAQVAPTWPPASSNAPLAQWLGEQLGP